MAQQVKNAPSRATVHANKTPVVAETRPFTNLLTFGSIILAALLAYWPALHGTLLWDDDAHITSAALQSLHGLWRIWFELGATQQYYPLLHSAFWIEHRVWGDAVLGYHLANLTQHALSACFVVLVVRALKLPGAWLAGLIFALHPVCVESVAWISEQKSTLSGVFYLAAMLTYLHFDKSRKRSQYFAAFGMFVLALLSKSVTATLPAVLLVIFWWEGRRLEWKRDVMPLLPWFVIGASSGLFTAWVEKTYIGAKGANYELTLVQHLLLTGRILCFYAGKALLPVNLMFSYPHWQLDPSAWWQYLFPLGVFTVLAAFFVFALRGSRGPLAAFLIFAGTLFPVLGFFHVFPFKFSYVADHFQYLAILAIIIPAACLLAENATRVLPNETVGYVAGVVLLAVLGALTWQQSSLYRDSETLYRATLERNPDSWMTHNNLAGVLEQIPGRGTEAVEEYEAAIRLKPDYTIAHNSLGAILMQTPGRLPDAISEFQASLRSQPNFVLAHNNLGIAYMRMPDKLADAITEFQTAIRLQPDYAKAHMNLGNALRQVPGKLPDAIGEYQTAVRLQPEYAPAHMNLGTALMQIPGRLPDAAAEFQTAARLQPKDAQTHVLLADVLAQMPDRLPDAVAEYQTALSLQPNDPETHLNLGDTLAKIPGQREQAIAQYQAVMQSAPESEAAKQAAVRLKALEGR